MFTKLKKTFAPHLTPDPLASVLPPTSTAAAAQATIKGAQLLRGRTEAKVESLTLDLDAARRTVADLQVQLGEAVGEARETSALMQDLKRAQDRVEQLEAGLAMAMQKDCDAVLALKNAVVLATVEAEYQGIATLKLVVGPRVDRALAELELLVQELGQAIDHARVASGPGIHASWVTDVTLAFELHLFKACRTLMPKGRAYLPLLGTKTFTDRIPLPEYARTRGRGKS